MIFKIKHHIEKSKLIKGFIVTILGSGSSKIILVLATFICSNLLGKMEFGELSFVRNTLNMILCICALNFSALCTKLATEAKTSIISLHRLFLLFLFSLIVCLFIGLFLILSPERYLLEILTTKTIVKFFKIVGVLLPLFMLQPLIEGILRGLKKFYLIGILQTTSSIFYLVAVFVGIKNDGLNGALIGVVLYYALYSFISVLILQRKYCVLQQLYKLRGAWSEKKSIVKMILPLFLMSFIDAPTLWIAQVILSKSASMEAVGSMTAMMQIRNLAMLIPSYFSNTYIAFAGELNTQKRYVEYYFQYQKIIRLYLLVGISMFVIFSVFAYPILFLYGREFVADWPVMLISNLSIPLAMLIGLFRIDLLLKDHQQYLLFFSIGWNIIWLFSLLFLNMIGIDPLYSFFISQNIGSLVFIISLVMMFNKDKKDFLQ